MARSKRPRDVNQRAKSIVDIATGEATDEVKDERDLAAVTLGSRGGKARAKNLTANQRTAIAKKAAKKRWSEKRTVKGELR